MPEYEEVSNIAMRVIRLIDRQRFHNSDATSHAVALQELEDLNREVKQKYGAFPEGWQLFFQRANTLLELAERHRGDGQWARRLDDVYTRVTEAQQGIVTLEQQRIAANVAAQQGKALLLNREEVKRNAAIYQQAKRQAVTTGAEIRFVDN